MNEVYHLYMGVGERIDICIGAFSTKQLAENRLMEEGFEREGVNPAVWQKVVIRLVIRALIEKVEVDRLVTRSSL